MAWIHVKALRVFVESVLRYGLPVNFQGMVLLPQKKTQKKLRDTLNQTYAHLDSAGGSGDVSELELVSKELNHFGVIAGLFRQIGGLNSRFVLFCSF